MSDSKRRVLAWLTLAATAVTWAAAFLVLPSLQDVPLLDAAGWAAPYLAFAVVGAVIIQHRPQARIGWLLALIGLIQGLGVLDADLLVKLASRPGWLAAVRWLELTTVLNPVTSLLLVLVVMTFPDGHLPSRRWRWALGALAAMLALVVADLVFSPAPNAPGLPPSALASPAISRILDPLTSYNLFALYLLLPVAAVVARYRGGDGVVRAQIKWFAVGVAALVILAGAAGLASGVVHSDVLQTFLTTAGMVAFACGIGVAVVRHRLFDVDLVISRGLTYAALAIIATAVYVTVVVGAGTLVRGSTNSNLVLSIAATVIVAVAFNPARMRLQALANQIVYGRRQSPYESLSAFTRSLADAYDRREILNRMAESLAAGVGAQAAAVNLDTGDGDHMQAAWPDPSRLPRRPPTRTLDVVHRGERLGSLWIWLSDRRDLNTLERGLLADLSVQAGLVLRNARLDVELERRLDELRASRRRLASAQDAERRRLERDLHDGAQHDLVGIRMKLALAEARASTGATKELASLLALVKEETAAALENIRGLARGIHPPLLESQGLASALAAHVRRLPLPVVLNASADRFDADVEATVYYCCVEALQNVVKHSGARSAWVNVTAADGILCFEVGDDGHGFELGVTPFGMGLQNIADRMDALGGTVSLESGRQGTAVRCSLKALCHTSQRSIVQE
ncbi:MAG TPA: histidine kinase [Candidatus Dormibacteraeota bacterium]